MKRIIVKIARGAGIGQAVEKILTGRTPNTGTGTTQQRAQELVTTHGSIKAAAAATGVNVETMRRWASGKQEAKNTARSNNLDKLNQAQREARLKDSRADRLAKSATGTAMDGGGRYAPTGGNSLRIKATVTVSSDQRERWIDVGPHIAPGTLDDMKVAYVNDGPDAAGEILEGAIHEYVNAMSVQAIHAIEF